MIRDNAQGRSADEVRALLQQRGVTATAQRLAIAEFVLNTLDHPTADEVFMGVREQLSGVSQATVYNTLNRLVECGIIRQFQRTGKRVRYDGNTEPHHHFFDVENGRLYDLDLEAIRVRLTPEAAELLDVSDVSVYVEGRRRTET